MNDCIEYNKEFNDTKNKYGIYLNFFGSKVFINTSHSRDADWIKFIFRYYLTEPTNDFDVEIDFSCDINTFRDTFLKNRCVYDFGVKVKGMNEERWNSNNTPLPPFLLPPLAGNYMLCHGCAVLSKYNKLNIIIGPSMSGKTATLLRFIDLGFKMVADDLLVIKVSEAKLIPYYKPIGLREGTLLCYPHLNEKIQPQNNIPSLVFKNDNGKRTWLVHMDDLYPDCYCTENEINGIANIFFISNNQKNEVMQISPIQAIDKMMNSYMYSNIETSSAIKTIANIVKNAKCYIAPEKSSELITSICLR